MDSSSDGGAQPKLLILSEAYSRHEAALRASLRAEYQIRDLRTERVSELASLVAWLPPGCALWRSTGGPLAWSGEVHTLNLVEYRLRELAWMQSKDAATGKNRPKPPDVPKYAHERDSEDAGARRKADAYRRRKLRG